MSIFRKTTIQDVNQVMEIIERAKAYLKSNGVDQWQNGYPNVDVIKEDIASGYGYVLECGDGIAGTIALSFDGEPYYDVIYDGEWLSTGDFLVIHRLAVSNGARGTDLASKIMRQVEQLCVSHGIGSIKIDTHEENVVMQKFVEKNGFTRCGKVILGSEGERVAFEKLL